MGLPEPAGQPGDPLEKQFLINVKGLDPKDALARMTGRKSWPLIEGGWKWICGPARNLQTVWDICGSQLVVQDSSRKNSACDGSVHCGIRSLSRWTELHGYQDSSTSAKVGKSTDQPPLHSHGRTRLSVPRVDPFHTRRINSSRRVHLRIAILVPPACASPSQFIQIQWWKASSSCAIPILDRQPSGGRSRMGLLWSSGITSQIYLCIRQAVQATWPILLRILPSRAVCQAVLSETKARRDSSTIRGLARVRSHIRSVVRSIPFCQTWLGFLCYSYYFSWSSSVLWLSGVVENCLSPSPLSSLLLKSYFFLQ